MCLVLASICLKWFASETRLISCSKGGWKRCYLPEMCTVVRGECNDCNGGSGNERDDSRITMHTIYCNLHVTCALWVGRATVCKGQFQRVIHALLRGKVNQPWALIRGSRVLFHRTNLDDRFSMMRDLDRDINYSRAVGLRQPETLKATHLPSAFERKI